MMNFRALTFAMVLVHVSGDLLDPNPPPFSAISGPPVVGLPVFLQEPEDSYYVVKNKPVTVICKAAPAIQINFKCASLWLRPEHVVTIEHVDPQTNLKYLQASVDVTRPDVEQYFGPEGYWCECTAWNNALGENNTPEPVPVKSRRGYIHVACKNTIFIIYYLFLCGKPENFCCCMDLSHSFTCDEYSLHFARLVSVFSSILNLNVGVYISFFSDMTED
jgi:hypothetical protein